MRVLVTLTDVEPAVRLNAMLEAAGYETTLVSPIDNLRAAIKRESPDLVVLTGGLIDTANVQLVRDLLWDGIAVVGLADIVDPALSERLRALGFVEVYAKPVDLDEVLTGIRRILDRRRLCALPVGQPDGGGDKRLPHRALQHHRLAENNQTYPSQAIAHRGCHRRSCPPRHWP